MDLATRCVSPDTYWTPAQDAFTPVFKSVFGCSGVCNHGHEESVRARQPRHPRPALSQTRGRPGAGLCGRQDVCGILPLRSGHWSVAHRGESSAFGGVAGLARLTITRESAPDKGLRFRFIASHYTHLTCCLSSLVAGTYDCEQNEGVPSESVDQSACASSPSSNPSQPRHVDFRGLNQAARGSRQGSHTS